MGGLLSGLLGIVALPPLSFTPAGLIWLVPWLSALHVPRPRRVVETILATGLPVGFAIGPLLAAEPRLALLVIGATLTPFILTALLAADRRGRGSLRRLMVAVIALCGLIAGGRALGLPLSLSLFLPTDFIHLPLIGVGGILAADLAIGLLQVTLAIGLNHLRARTVTSSVIARVGVALIALVPLALIRPPIPSASATNRPQIAIIQTNITPQTRHRAIADGGLESLNARRQRLALTARQLDADWIVWPEAASTGFLGPDWRAIDSSASHLRHGYNYHRPGRIDSETRISANGERRAAALPGWRKQYPLPFAERGQIQAHRERSTAPDIDALEVLICSDAIHPAAVDRAAARRPRVILNPASLAYLGSIPLAGPYTTGVAALPLPNQYTPSEQSPGVIYGLIAIGFIALGGGSRSPVRSPDPPSRYPAWPVVGLAAASIGIASALQHRSLERLGAAATPAPGAPLETRAIQSPVAGHRGSIALLAREFGVATDWQAVPASTDAAMSWLCRQTGLIPMDPTASLIRPPAFGLQQSTTGLRAVRWRVGDKPIAFDASTGEFQSIDVDAPAIHWLATARTLEDCRSVIAPK